MLIVTGTIEIAPEGVTELIPAAIEMAKATRAEVGCLTYRFWQDLEQETRRSRYHILLRDQDNRRELGLGRHPRIARH